MQPGEAFNVISYSDEVDALSNDALIKSTETERAAREYIQSMVARGSTNLHAALQTALQCKPKKGQLPITLFLTDGLPTVGETSEAVIRNLTTNHNPHQHRVFTFGVGYDVNTPLLDKIATSSRGFATFVLPGEDVETKVTRVFRGLDGPTLAGADLRVVNANGKRIKRVTHMLPRQLPDLYDGDQLVVLGRYKGKKPLRFVLQGTRGKESKSFQFQFEVESPIGSAHSFVARLWASRRIGELVDAVRDLGADPMHHNPAAQTQKVSYVDPKQSKLAELTDEIVRLSKEFGILTEYTAFLAREGIDLADVEQVNEQAMEQLQQRAIDCRVGIGSVNQEFNNAAQRNQLCVNIGNRFLCPDMSQASIATVQQWNQGSFYRRNGQWISNRLIDETEQINPDRVIEFGSDSFMQLVWKLAEQNRNNELALEGDILIEVEGEKILIKGPQSQDPVSDTENRPDQE